MNYECVTAFNSDSTHENYRVGTRISKDEYDNLQHFEQKFFKELAGESFGEQIEDMIEREDHLENE